MCVIGSIMKIRTSAKECGNLVGKPTMSQRAVASPYKKTR
jgi:hypothetical protein